MKRLLLFAAAMLVACDTKPPAPVVVYVPAEFEERLSERFADSDFAATIIASSSEDITNRVIAKNDNPRADILITTNVIDIWRAADEGALRPIAGEALADLPLALKDPDGSWAALGYRRLFIGMAPGGDAESISSLPDLGLPDASGQLCLTSSGLAANRALIGLLIEEMGVKPAERLVRSWVRNLAAAPFADESRLQDALEQGTCGLGIVSGVPDGSSVELIALQPGYLLIDGIGISRHAENAETAQRVVTWLLSGYRPDELDGYAARNAGIAGWRDREAVLLAERAGYR